MPPLPSATDLAACVGDFSAELEQLAWAIAREVVAIELSHRAPAAPLPKPRRAKAAPAPAIEAPPIEVVEPPPAEPVAAPRGRRPWTRERVIEELARWLIELPGLDAPSLRRRKQGALVDAARREFGRFEAALNASNLALAQKYPDGIPKAHELARSERQA
ncbi:MAG: hypothetical protein K8W52_26395 [Deltaproteobacteria bacterium]|nr:hypothetical protein [Deltaproteobacteria bacterium]